MDLLSIIIFVKVRAINEAGPGPYSDSVTIGEQLYYISQSANRL